MIPDFIFLHKTATRGGDNPEHLSTSNPSWQNLYMLIYSLSITMTTISTFFYSAIQVFSYNELC